MSAQHTHIYINTYRQKKYFVILLCIGTETMTKEAALIAQNISVEDGGTTTASTPGLLGKCTRRKLQATAASNIIKMERGDTVLTLGKKLRCFLCLNRLFKANVSNVCS